MDARDLTLAWFFLVGLSLMAAFLSAGLSVRLAAPLILFLALVKARIILSDYLNLKTAPAWRRGFTSVLSFFAAMVLALYVLG